MTIRSWLKDPRKRAILSIGILVIVATAFLWPIVVSRDARHLTAYRSGDEDVSRFRSEIEALGLPVEAMAATPHALDDVADPKKTLLIIVGTERRYDPSEARAVLDFLRAGGSVILADETGYGSDIASEAGFAFSSQRVVDSRSFRGTASLVATTARVGDASFPVMFNSPSKVVELSQHAAYETLAQTSESRYPDGSFLDVNGNGEVDRTDEPGPFPLIVSTTVGEGRLVLVSDTGLFMNAQFALTDYDNADFLSALVRSLAASDGVVILDESRHAPTPLVAAWANGVRAVGRVAGGDLAPFLALAVLIAATFAAWRFTRPTEDWSHHAFDVSQHVPLPESVRPDLSRAQRMARAHISERFNRGLEEVSAMTTEELLSLSGDRTLAEAASGVLRSDPGPIFRSFSSSRIPIQESPP